MSIFTRLRFILKHSSTRLIAYLADASNDSDGVSICSAVYLLYRDASADLKSFPKVAPALESWQVIDLFPSVNPQSLGSLIQSISQGSLENISIS